MNNGTKDEATATGRRRRWREQDAREVLEQWRRSGESLERFAQTHGLVANRLYRWRARLGDAATTTKPVAETASPVFIPVTVREAMPPSSGLMVTIGESLRVEVSELSSASAAWVAALARAIGEGAS